MTVRLRDLIRTIRQSKTAAEERAVVLKECAAIRTSLKEENDYRHRNVAKLLYIHMLGYPAHFGQIECLKLIVSPYYSDKRVGYLGLMLLLDEKQEVLMLSTNSLRNDLNHPNQYVVGLALCSLANIASPGIARDLTSDVVRLLSSSNPYIRKKATLCALRIIRKAPETLENFIPKIRGLLSERNHGVLITAISLIIEITIIDPSNIPPFRRLVSVLVRILKSLVQSGYLPEHDVCGITDPFLQVKILRLLRILGKGDPESSDSMNDILAQVATNTESVRNVGNAILYECVQTIMAIDSESGLRVLAINILGRFLLNRDNNIRYVALNTLSKVVTADTQAVQRHRNTIVDCLKDHDISIRRRALDLVYVLVNESNVRMLVRELVAFLQGADIEFRADLTAKICLVTEKYAPSKRWHVDTILKVISVAGEYIPDEVINNMIKLIAQTPELHAYAVQKLYLAMLHDILKQSLVQLGMWCIGEFGDILVTAVISNTQSEDWKDDNTASMPATLSVSDKDVVDLCERVLKHPSSTASTKEYVLTALIKLTERFAASQKFNSLGAIQKLLDNYRTSMGLELQQRACEYSSLIRNIPNDKRSVLLERIPVLEDPTPPSNTPPNSTAAHHSHENNDSNQQTGPKPSDMNLLEAIFSTTPQQNQSIPSSISTVLGGGANTASNILELLSNTPSPTTTINNSGGIFELLGGSTTPATTTPNFSTPILTPMSSTLNSNNPTVIPTSPILQSTPTTGSPNFGRITAVDKGGLLVILELLKQQSNPNVGIINMQATNKTNFPFTEFIFQAAVPKYLKVQVGSPSGSVMNPGESITQQIKVINSLQGQKPVLMRIKVEYNVNGQIVSEQNEVANFPLNF